MTGRRHPVVLVAAVARNGVIGRENAMPWRIPSDFRHFRAVTLGKPMIVGRKNFEAIGRALPGRQTIVVTRQEGYEAPGAEVVHTVEGALELADRLAGEGGEIIVAGGADIYAATLPIADRLVISEVDLKAEGEVVFPPFDKTAWREVSRETHGRVEGDEAGFEVVVWERQIRRGSGAPPSATSGCQDGSS